MAPLRFSTYLSLWVFLAAALASAGARATDYGVSPTGSDTASGQSGAPWLTIQRALKTVKAGDTVTVEDGTYAGLACDTVSGTSSAPIVFRSRNKWGAKITSATSGSSQDWVQFSSCSYITFDGFEVSGATRSGIAILGNTDDGSDARGVVIQNCYSHNNGGTTVAGRHDGIFSGFALDLTIQDNTIDTTGEHGIYVSNSADNPSILRNTVSNTGANCIQINADVKTQVNGKADGLISNWRIEGNVVSTCKGAAAVNLDGAIQGVAINNLIYNASNGGFTLFMEDGYAASHDNLIANNTVYNPTGTRSAIQIADGADNNVVFNNIFVAKSAAFEVQGVNGLMHDYNIVSGFDGGSAAAHESTVTTANAASLFAGASSGNLKLSDGASAAIDKGVASYGGDSAPTTDVLGAVRPAGAGYDIGAYEYNSAAPVTGSGGSGAGTGGTTGTGGKAGSGGSGAGGKGGGTGGNSATGGASGSAGRSGGTGGRQGGTGGTVVTTGSGGSAGQPGGTGTGGTNVGGSPGTGGSTTVGTGGGTTAGAGGTDPGEMNASSGCSCDVTGGAPGGMTLQIFSAALVLLALAAARRRRSRVPRAR